MAMMDSLSALNGLTANQGNPQSSVQGYLNRRARLDELKRNLSLSGVNKDATGKVTSGFASGATPEDVAQLESDVHDDPEMGQNEQDRLGRARTHQEEDIRYASPEATQQRGDALAATLAPIKEKDAGALALEQEKTKGTLASIHAQQEPMMQFLGGKGASGPASTVDPATGATTSMRPSINAKGELSLSGQAVPQQVAAQQHAAAVGLGQLHQMRQIADTLNQAGAIGPVAGRFGDAATSTGLDAWLMNPKAAQAFNDFKTQASLMKSNLGVVHGGSRGGASPLMAQRFDKLINPNQSYAGFKGGVDAFERWLTAYSGAKNSAELDAADAELGIPLGGPEGAR